MGKKVNHNVHLQYCCLLSEMTKSQLKWHVINLTWAIIIWPDLSIHPHLYSTRLIFGSFSKCWSFGFWWPTHNQRWALFQGLPQSCVGKTSTTDQRYFNMLSFISNINDSTTDSLRCHVLDEITPFICNINGKAKAHKWHQICPTLLR